MRPMGVAFLAASLLLAGCGEAERPPPPYFVIPPGPAAPPPAAAPDATPASAPVAPRDRTPSVQYFLPAHPEDLGRGPAPVPRPGAATRPFYAAPPNSGPVTGYGPGGMAQPPGAPPNPPYPPGGLSAPR